MLRACGIDVGKMQMRRVEEVVKRNGGQSGAAAGGGDWEAICLASDGL